MDFGWEVVTGAGAALAGAGGVCGAFLRAGWEKWQKSADIKEKLPCEKHTQIMAVIQDDIKEMKLDSKASLLAIQKIEIGVARQNGRVEKLEERVSLHVADKHAHEG